jgi:hypothetical protein
VFSKDKNVMKFQFIVAVVVGIFLIPSASVAVKIGTGGKSESELNTEMVIRCQSKMGEFGHEGINVCINAEREARVALMDYPDELEDIARRCYRAMRKAGWDMVQICTDKDVAARYELESLSAEYAEIVDLCTDELSRRGHDRVKRCADKRIAEQQGTSD